MSRKSLRERICEGAFVLDGAMGTELFARGIEPGTCNDYLNIESPETVLEVHRSYFDAGSDGAVTNTFGANKYVLARHGLADKVREINLAGAGIARKAAGEERYVLGGIGPSGDFLKPLGMLEPEELKEAFAEQVRGLVDGRVDGIIIETMTALDEIAIAVETVKSECDLPVFASMSFDASENGFRTMMGVDVESAVSKLVSLGVDAVGYNCGTASLGEYIELAEQFAATVKACGKDVVILAEPNAGKPELIGDKAVYNVSPEEFASAAQKIHQLGVNIIGGCCGTGSVNIVGGCCGTTPSHIGAVAEALRNA
ncbi:MAG: homocysteine S-methyltransferase family protein [Planctomycetota bacterium]|jgi:5-methyltetrahydrofolate--homocysteine methyltransferase